MSKENGGPAFPGDYETRTDQGRGHLVKRHDSGMSLRDYFAAKAMQGFMSNDALLTRYGAMASKETISPESIMATAAYLAADAMLKERTK